MSACIGILALYKTLIIIITQAPVEYTNTNASVTQAKAWELWEREQKCLTVMVDKTGTGQQDGLYIVGYLSWYSVLLVSVLKQIRTNSVQVTQWFLKPYFLYQCSHTNI